MSRLIDWLDEILRGPWKRSAGYVFVKGRGASLAGRIIVEVGEGNSVIFDEGARLKGNLKFRGSRNTIHLGRQVNFLGSITIKGNGQSVTVGDHSTSNGTTILCQEAASVSIGR
ncbi:hypothetical protein J5J10_15255 [Ciceribacter sp. L1K23]|uniref:hypothetical protein n=1 Tax=Ciceribacter sp. L1K23 TaxID=2820276 RepID=UPI001B837EF5|nr:hypothetical protein [Ciceribacter sp. L1K23]MBR0557044.1 hypothetical protein [Ciceribacter sp. L1K23]